MEMVWKFRRGISPALALTVHDGSRTLEFLLEGLDHTRLTVFSDRPEQYRRESTWRRFRQRLALMNIEVDDTILPIEESDGFTPGTGETDEGSGEQGMREFKAAAIGYDERRSGTHGFWPGVWVRRRRLSGALPERTAFR